MNFQVTGKITNLSTLAKSWDIKSNKVPSLPLSFKTSFDGDLEKANLRKTTLTIGKSDFSLTTQGTLQKLKQDPKIELTTNLSLINGPLSKLWGIKPVGINTKIVADKKTIKASDLQVDAGKSDMNGELSIHLFDKPIFIEGKLSSTYFDVYDIIDSSTKPPSSQKVKPSKKNFLSTDKLPFDLLKELNLNIQLNVANLKFSNEISEYAGVDTNIVIRNKELKMPTQIRIFGGKIQNQLVVNADKKSVNVETKANSIQSNKIKQLSKYLQNSSLNLALSLKGSGESLHDLAGSAQ